MAVRSRALPRPFYDDWWGERRDAAHNLWAFHSALTEPRQPAGKEEENFFKEERAAAEAGEALRAVPEGVWTAAYQSCTDFDLDRGLLGAQVEAACTFATPIRFETSTGLDTFVRLWAVPHGRLLAQLAGHRSSMRRRWVDELSRGFFYLSRLLTLPEDVRADRLFIPEEELRWADVTKGQLREGTVTESIRRLLWKQSVRVRDALAQGQPLLSSLSLRRRYVLKKYWMGALALLNELERRDFDLWSRPLALPWWRRMEVYLQTVFGRTSPR